MTAPNRLASLILRIALATLALALMAPRLLAAPFNDVGGPSGNGDTTDDVGAAWGDYDNDGDLDLYLSKDGSPNGLWRNNGNGTFTGVGAASGTNNNGAGRGVAWGDYDSDGFLDLYLANDGPNRLYHNNGNGTFTDVGAASGTADGGSGRGVAWGDYDNDGFLDLYLANDGANRLYHNNGNGTFTEVGAATGTADTGNGVGVAWGDYDNDRDLDLYLANDNDTNRLYRNNGNGTFTETAAAAGCADNGRSSGVAWGDYDSDGDLDLYVGKYGTVNRLFRNNGNGTFTNVAASSNTDDTGNTTGVGWGDYDNDGDLDLYVANVLSANRHYRNNGNGTFTDVASSMGTNDPGNAQGVAWADYDNDGDLDLYLANVLGTDRLYRNDTAVAAGSHWLHVNLVGSVSNRSGIGARVRCVTGATSRTAEISGGSGYLSQGSLTAEFGMGVSAVDTVVVYWPSGLVQAVPNLGVDQRVTITEAALFTDVGAASGTDDGGSGYMGLAWGDYDQDGDPDLYLLKINEPNKLYRNNGNGTFTDVGAASGTNSTAASRAAAWGDYDNDGDIDLYVSTDTTNRLYRNNSNGTFTDIAAASGTLNNAIGRGVSWADYDRDNDLDLYVCNTNAPNRLYRNDMNGTFTDVAAASGTADPQDSQSAPWGDYDSDGDLDLYLTNYSGGTNRLYRNNGNGTFTEVGATSGTADTGSNTGADWGDYDNDGDLDLYVAKYGQAHRLYRNNGNGTFTDVAAASGTDDPAAGCLGVAWADYDNDRDLDLYLSNDGFPNRLYRNNGNGTFTEVGSIAGTGETALSHGAAWADYDLDGDLDLYLAKDGPNRLYRNDHAVPSGRHWLHVDLVGRRSNRSGIGARVRCIAGGVTSVRQVSGGGGYFSQGSLTAEFGLGTAATVDSLVVHWPSGIVHAVASPSADQRITVTEPESEYFTSSSTAVPSGFGCSAWGDYDNDGDLDLFVAHLLYRNNANGTFTDVSAAAGINAGGGDFNGAAWADYDNDGDLDLHVSRSSTPSLLYRNNGNGTFTNVATAAGTSAHSQTSVWGDYDNDGYVDLYTTHPVDTNHLFKNNGNGTFTDVGVSSGTSAPSNTLGLAWGDYDNDNALDLYIGGFQGTPSRLYHNNGNGTFTDVAVPSGTWVSDVQGVSWGDYDNDRYLDLYIARWPFFPNALCRNNGNGTFTTVTAAAGVEGVGAGTAGVWGDYNNDGHLDIYATTDSGGQNQLYRSAANGTFTNAAAATATNFSGLFQSASWADYDNDGDLDLHAPGQLCRNDSPTRHWLHVNLVGTVSNRAGIGAHVRCVADGRRMTSQISGGEGLSQGSLIAEFGLGASTTVDSVMVFWPSGIIQTVMPGIDQRITITESGTVPAFVEIGEDSGTNDAAASQGVAWGDYDNDGDLDLYVSRFGVPNRLYRNNGNRTFTDVGPASGTDDAGNGHGAAWGDYDNDGDLDLYLSNFGGTNRLYKNNGNGTFTEVGAVSGTGDVGVSRGVAWGDYNHDGHLDLYVARENTPNRLYRNSGNGTFTEVGVATGTADAGNGTGVAWGDYDADGDLDLYVANYLGTNRLYRNNGNETFTEIGAASGTNFSGPGGGVAWGDYDNDSDLDLYLGNLGGGNCLFRNNGNGTFTNVAAASGTISNGNTRGVAWADYDNDTDLDLYVANEAADQLYRNNGDGTFTEIGATAGTNDGGLGVGAAWADFDRDGDLDLYLANSQGTNRLYMNYDVPNAHHWLQVGLVATRSNRFGIGARVRCVTGTTTMVREISGGSGYLSQCSLDAEFGLGTASSVDTLEVIWPSGARQSLVNPGVDQRIILTEPVLFTDVAASAGVNDFNFGRASAWGDYDNDGDIDLYVANDDADPSRLYRNNSNGTFTDVGVASGTAESGINGATWGDYDNDGFLDLYLTAATNRLFHNQGNGTFSEVGAASGTNYSGANTWASWGDFNNDGHLDLYLITAPTHRLYQNMGNGTFTEVSAASGINVPGTGSLFAGSAWGDYDTDGDLDLFVSQLTGNILYRNNGNQTFSDVTTASGTAASSCRGVTWGDYDNDNDLDAYVMGFVSNNNRLYRNNGDGTFTDVAAASGTQTGGGFSGQASWGDYDNDGHLDLYFRGVSTRLYRNRGNGTFTDVASSTGTATGQIFSAPWGDYDSDGDLDLFVTVSSEENRLFRNESADPARHHWLHVDLVGTESNRAGIGARVRCVAGGMTRMQEVSGGIAWQQSSLTAEFGLGATTTVDSLVISWPSGIVQAIANPGMDQRITVTEPGAAPFQFTDAGATSGTNDSGPSMGVAWGDYDSDGDLDLYLAQSGPTPQNRLYRNNGNGTFTDVAAASGTIGNGNSAAAIWGDYDNDGDLDLYLTAHGGTNQLFRNNGDQTFTDVGSASGTNDTGSARGAAWGDYDQDGLLDLYVAKTGANRLYHNLGNGTFSEVGAATGTNDAGDGTGVAWADYDSDGDLDLFVANHLTPNRLYRNNDNGTFTDVSVAAGTDHTGPSHGVAWGDFDNDGDLDLYVANLGTPNRLYRNNGNGTFAEVGAASGTNDPGMSRGAAWGDFDDDGYLDLYVTNEGLSRLYKNNGNGTFNEVASAYGTAGAGMAIGVAWADFDGDGDLDLYVAVLDGANRLYRNDSTPLVSNHWLEVDLVGTQSNRVGIGARVRCVAGGRSLIREISGGSGFLSQEPLTARFGLGQATAVDTVEVRWPSGIVQIVTNPGVDQRITVTEQETSGAPDAATIPSEYSLHANVPNPFNPATMIRFDLPSAGTVHLTVFDATGRAVRKLVDGVRFEAGQQHATWDGRSDQGHQVASGIYFYRIVANDFRATKRMTLLK